MARCVPFENRRRNVLFWCGFLVWLPRRLPAYRDGGPPLLQLTILLKIGRLERRHGK